MQPAPTYFSDALKQIEVPISSWKDFQDYYLVHFAKDRARWCFRGHADTAWSLVSALERLTKETRDIVRAERTLMSAFKRAAHRFCTDPPPEKDMLGWLALMQHWGVPTRLMDFTLSPYVALFFALRDQHVSPGITKRPATRAALWAINHVTLKGIAIEELNEARIDGLPHLKHETPLGDPDLFTKCFCGDHGLDFVAPVQPTMHNERLALQRGLFLCSSNVNFSFEVTILQPPGFHMIMQQGAANAEEVPATVRKNLPQLAQKLVFSEEAGAEIFSAVLRMNINSGTLFAGLDGYARSIVDLFWLLNSLDHVERNIVGYDCVEQFGWLG